MSQDLIPYVHAITSSTLGTINGVVLPAGIQNLFINGNTALETVAINTVWSTGNANYRTVSGQVLADGLATPLQPMDVGAYSMMWNGATWDRLTSQILPPGGGIPLTTPPTSVLNVISFAASFNKTFNSYLTNTSRTILGPTGDGVVGVSNALDVAAYALAWNGASFDRLRTPNIFKTVTATAAGSTALWTPAAGKKFRVMKVHMSITSNAAAAVAAVLLSRLLDGATFFGISDNNYIPLAGVIQQHQNFTFDLGNGYLSSAANNVLNIDLSFALTAGILDVTVSGTEE